MHITKLLKAGAWVLIIMNLLMALGSIWIFMRMAPAIEVIIDRNERSLQACEEMLSALAQSQDDTAAMLSNKDQFVAALERAQNNITESGEADVLDAIRKKYENAFTGDSESKTDTIFSINALSEINRKAMEKADSKARQIGSGGAWGIVFMASLVFAAGMIFLKIMQRSVIKPMEEIHDVILANRGGNILRRCSGHNIPNDIKTIFTGLNDLLDKLRSS